MATASIPPVVRSLGLSPLGQAWLVAIPIYCFGAAAFLGVRVRRAAGEERALTGLLGLLVLGLVVRALLGVSGLFAGTVIACSAIGLMNVLLPSLIHRRFAAYIGAMTAAYTVALGVGGAVAAALAQPASTLPHASVQLSTGIWALPAVAACLLWLPAARRLGPEDHSGQRAGMGRFLGRRLAWLVTCFFGLQSFVYYAIFSWVPAVLADRGVSPQAAGLLLGLMNIVGIVGSFFAPLAAVRMRNQRWALVAVASLVTTGILGVWLGPVGLAPLWITVFGGGQGAALSLGLLLIIVRAADSDAAAALSSMAQSFGYLLAAMGPLLFGALHVASQGWSVSFGLVLAALVAWITIGFAVWQPGVRSLSSGARPAQPLVPP